MKTGDKLKNGATVMAFRECEYFGNNKRVVLAYWNRPHDKFVTWRVDAMGNTFLGHYFENEADAMGDYLNR